MHVRVMLTVVFCSTVLLAQEPTFRYTSSDGKTSYTGHLERGGGQAALSFVNESGVQISIKFKDIRSVLLTKREPPYNSPCSGWSKAVVTFTDNTPEERGC